MNFNVSKKLWVTEYGQQRLIYLSFLVRYVIMFLFIFLNFKKEWKREAPIQLFTSQRPVTVGDRLGTNLGAENSNQISPIGVGTLMLYQTLLFPFSTLAGNCRQEPEDRKSLLFYMHSNCQAKHLLCYLHCFVTVSWIMLTMIAVLEINTEHYMILLCDYCT